jgi:hypothetical protein
LEGLAVMGVAGLGARPLTIRASCPSMAWLMAMPAMALVLEEPMGLLDLPGRRRGQRW